jgi:Domain of unknown function DUF1828
MPASSIEADFKKKVCDKVRLEAEGKDRYRVLTPFQFDDGDHLSIVLQQNNGVWQLSDEGHTLMHLSYRIDEKDFEQGNRRKLIDKSLSSFGIKDFDGVLQTEIENDSFGDALFSYVQGILHITDVGYLSREQVRSTFMDDLRNFVEQSVPANKLQVDWHDPRSDPDGKYPVDHRISGNGKPLYLFGVANDSKCDQTTIVLYHYMRAGVKFMSLAIFEDQAEIGRKQLARLTDVVDRQFSSLPSNETRIKQYLADHLAGSPAQLPEAREVLPP